MSGLNAMQSNIRTKERRTAICSALILLLSFFLASPLQAAEPVEIVVTGIEGAVLENVQEALVLPSGPASEEKIDPAWLERFAKEAEADTKSALEPFGYYRAQVTVVSEPVRARYRVRVQVIPGEPARLTEVNVALAGAGREERRLLRLVTRFPLQKGDVLLHQIYEEAKATLKLRAKDLGYLDAEFPRHEIRVAASAATASIDLLLDTGEKHYFGATKIGGAPDYPDSFLRRHLSYREGEVFSYPSLGETQLNFTNSERFKEVSVTPGTAGAEDPRVPVTVQLEPGPRITLRPGIGYGTDTGARFTVRYRDLNLFHLGHELNTGLYVAERLKALVTGYILPDPRDIRSSTTLQVNLQQEETDTYDSRILALELARNRSFGKGKLGTAYLKVQYEDYAVAGVESDSRLVLPGVRFTDDRYNNPIRPRRGSRYTLDLHGTHQLLGSDTALVQLLAEGSRLTRLPWRLSLHSRAKVGATLLSDPLSDIPPSLRFFTGGDQSVRGYSYKSLGPRDALGRVVGGKQLLVGSLELERALFKKWGVSVFYDAGNSFNSLSDITLFHGAGVGLHYYTPVGAFNLSVAKPLWGDRKALHLHLTVGLQL